MKKATIISFFNYITATILNSYAMLFFSNKKFFAIIVLLSSFINPYTGLAGLIATLIAALSAYFIGFSREQVKTGLFTYSGLLAGLGMGTFYEFSLGFW
ncbi:MAG: urea transporter, partial [Chitinophagaceae bacterium]|nr:urea transporter [Chitinophagaceae bacterium]